MAKRRLGIGVDPARMGRNKTVIAAAVHLPNDRPSVRVPYLRRFEKLDTVQVAAQVRTVDLQLGRADTILVDIIGLGSGPYDQLRHALGPDRVRPFTASESPKGKTKKEIEEEKKRFMNWKAQAYFHLAHLFADEDIAIVNDRPLGVQLNRLKSYLADNGKIVIDDGKRKRKDDDEPRDDAENSPDEAEAVMMAVWAAVKMRSNVWVGD